MNSLPQVKKEEPPPKAPSPVRTYSRQTRQASIGVKRTIAAVMSGSRSLQKKRELEVKIFSVFDCTVLFVQKTIWPSPDCSL